MRRVAGKASSVWLLAIIQLRSWLHSPRVLIMGGMIAAQCFAQICAFHNMLNRNGYSAYWAESVFYQFYSGCNMPMMSVFFLIMIGDIPYRMAHQEFFLIRCSRKKWMTAQIVYCVLSVLAMIVVLLVLISAMTLPISTSGYGWSDDWRMMNLGSMHGMALIDEGIRNRFTPVGALLAATLPMFCFWLLMVLIVLVFAILGMPEVGVLIYASILVLNVTVLFEMIPYKIPFPMDYATLEGVFLSCSAEGGLQLGRVCCGYAAMIATVIMILIYCAEKCELDCRVQ